MNTPSELVAALEKLIKDENKQAKISKNQKEQGLNFVGTINLDVVDNLMFSKKGTLLYYGIAYELFDSKDQALYKSLDDEIYFIESLNAVPYRYYKIDTSKY